jgi:hypothetical protein
MRSCFMGNGSFAVWDRLSYPLQCFVTNCAGFMVFAVRTLSGCYVVIQQYKDISEIIKIPVLRFVFVVTETTNVLYIASITYYDSNC